MRFLLFVEGDTEQVALPGFLHRWLDPKLCCRVGVKPIRQAGNHSFLRHTPKRAQMELGGPKASEIVAAIGLLDLYGYPEYPTHLKQTHERYEWVVRTVERSVDHPKFHMHCAVHEVEAWLLSQPNIFTPEVQAHLPAAASPEAVDFEKPPSQLLDDLYRRTLQRRYNKVADGKALFSKLDPDLAYSKCPYLHRMLDDMLGLARKAGLCEPAVLR
jgi:hypothetical protein